MNSQPLVPQNMRLGCLFSVRFGNCGDVFPIWKSWQDQKVSQSQLYIPTVMKCLDPKMLAWVYCIYDSGRFFLVKFGSALRQIHILAVQCAFFASITMSINAAFAAVPWNLHQTIRENNQEHINHPVLPPVIFIFIFQQSAATDLAVSQLSCGIYIQQKNNVWAPSLQNLPVTLRASTAMQSEQSQYINAAIRLITQ